MKSWRARITPERTTADRRRRFLTLGAVFLCLLVAGCRSTPRRAPAAGAEHRAERADRAGAAGEAARPDRVEAEAGTTAGADRGDRPDIPTTGSRVAGHSVEGRPIPYSVHGFGPRTTLLLATIHGDEAAGTPLLEELARQLEADPRRLRGRRVVVVPRLNPDGLADDRRTNARGVDLNRNFPASNRRTGVRGGDRGLSEPESRALDELLRRYEPEKVMSIHGWVGLVDWDGPGEGLARRLGELMRLPARRLGSRPGSLGSYLGVDQGVPILTLEMPGSARRASPDELWERYGPGLLEFATSEGDGASERSAGDSDGV